MRVILPAHWRAGTTGTIRLVGIAPPKDASLILIGSKDPCAATAAKELASPDTHNIGHVLGALVHGHFTYLDPTSIGIVGTSNFCAYLQAVLASGDVTIAHSTLRARLPD